MARRTLLVVGAGGDVGQGIARAACARGWNVIAAGRDETRLAAALGGMGGEQLAICPGDLATEDGAKSLWDAAYSLTGGIDAVVISVNAPNRLALLSDWTEEGLKDLFATNLITHFHAAKVMLPRLPDDGILIGIGGGTADNVIPKMAHLSVIQAGLRMLYQGLASERKTGAEVRELIIASMVNGASKRDRARPDWVTDDDVGRHVCAVLSEPNRFPGPILQLKTREQVECPG